MLVVVRDRVAKLVKAGKSQDEVVEARPTKEFEEKYGGANFNAAQWIGRAYVDQKIALEKRQQEIAEPDAAAGAAVSIRESPIAARSCAESVQHNAPHRGLFAHSP